MNKREFEASPFTELIMQSIFVKDNFGSTNDDRDSISQLQISNTPLSPSFTQYLDTSEIEFLENYDDCNDIDVKCNDSNQTLKRKYFTKKEDELLTAAALVYDQKSWNLIAQCVPGRTPKQCRDRWVNYLQPSLKLAPWTCQEDKLLISLVNVHGTHWAKMRVHFPNRSTNCLKNRWHWLVKNQMHVIKMNNTFILNSNGLQKKQFGKMESQKNNFIKNINQENNQSNNMCLNNCAINVLNNFATHINNYSNNIKKQEYMENSSINIFEQDINNHNLNNLNNNQEQKYKNNQNIKINENYFEEEEISEFIL